MRFPATIDLPCSSACRWRLSWWPWTPPTPANSRAWLRVAVRVCISMTVAIGSAAVAQERADLGPEADATTALAPVTLDGRVLFRVSGVTAFPAETRAHNIQERLRAFAANRSIPVDSLRIVDEEDYTRIVAGDATIMHVFDVDAAAEGISRRDLAAAIRSGIAHAVVDYRHDRQLAVLLRRGGMALVATVFFVLGFIAIGRGLRWLVLAIERRYKSRLRSVHIQSFHFIQADRIWTLLIGLLRFVRVVGLIVLALGYLHFVFGLFPWTRPLAIRGSALLLGPLQSMGQAVLAAIPGLIFIAILILVTRYFLRVARLFFESIEKETLRFSGFDPDWALPTYRIARILFIAFAVVVAYPYIPGSNTAAFKGMSVFIGIIFSIGSSSLISNVIAGYTMTYRRAFKVGDRVRIGDVVGEVTEMRLLVTHVRSLKNESVVIPNSTILQSHVINYSTLARTQGLILHTTVGIGYETPWRQVEAMLLLAAERTPGLRGEPPPFVLQKALGDFCVTYEVNVYTDQPQNVMKLYTALHQNILDVFNEYGVQIMTPAYEGDPDQPKVVPRDKWFEQPAPSPMQQPAPPPA